MELVSPSDYAKEKVQSVQEYSRLAARSLVNLFKRPLYVADMLQQADLIGFGSLPIVLAACFFTGAALALNSASTLDRFGAETVIGQLVSVGIVRELGPVKKLVTPRVAATIVMLFFLTILGDLLGLIGGAFVATILLGLDSHQYWSSTWQTLVYSDVFTGLAKPVVFGFIVATIGCYYGLSTKGGTQGVGRATTEAVVAAMILIIAVDVFITRLLMVTLGT